MLLPCPQHALFLALPVSADPAPLGVPQPCSRCGPAWDLRCQTCDPSSAADRMSAWLLGRSNDANGAPILSDLNCSRLGWWAPANGAASLRTTLHQVQGGRIEEGRNDIEANGSISFPLTRAPRPEPSMARDAPTKDYYCAETGACSALRLRAS